MAIPPWTIELLRRGITDAAKKAGEPETFEKLKSQAGGILQELPQTAARGLDAVMRTAESRKKAVRRWTRKHTSVTVAMLNATGVLDSDQGTGVPLAPAAIDGAVELLAGDTVRGNQQRDRLSRRMERCIGGTDLTIAVAHRFDAAVAAIGLINDNNPIVIHRSNAVSLPRICCSDPLPALPDFFTKVNGSNKIVEVGGSNRVDLADFDGLDHFTTVLADDGNRAVVPFDFGDRHAIQAVVLPVATVMQRTHSNAEHPPIPSATEMLAAGADIVVMPGDGVAGGPPCGLVIGNRNIITKLRSSARWNLLAASDATLGMIAATLESSGSSVELLSPGRSLPVEQLLVTSEENLRGRAERLATRLTGNDSIATCQVTAADAKLTDQGRWRFPSRQLRIRHKTRAASDWQLELTQEVPAVFAMVDGDDLIIDLRWISASNDAKLAEALVGDQSDASTTQINSDWQ